MRRSTAFIALALGATVTTGAGPQPGTSGPGGGVGWVHYYGWSTEG